jgi:hypothetical protein
MTNHIARQTTTDALLERTVRDFLILQSLLDPTRTRSLRKDKAEKVARQIIAKLNEAINATTIPEGDGR